MRLYTMNMDVTMFVAVLRMHVINECFFLWYAENLFFTLTDFQTCKWNGYLEEQDLQNINSFHGFMFHLLFMLPISLINLWSWEICKSKQSKLAKHKHTQGMAAYLSHLCQHSPVSLVVPAHNTGNYNLDKEEKSLRNRKNLRGNENDWWSAISLDALALNPPLFQSAFI